MSIRFSLWNGEIVRYFPLFTMIFPYMTIRFFPYVPWNFPQLSMELFLGKTPIRPKVSRPVVIAGSCKTCKTSVMANSPSSNMSNLRWPAGNQWFPTRWCPSWLAKLVNITPISLWLMVLVTIVVMGLINQLLTGGAPHCMDIGMEIWVDKCRNLAFVYGLTIELWVLETMGRI